MLSAGFLKCCLGRIIPATSSTSKTSVVAVSFVGRSRCLSSSSSSPSGFPSSSSSSIVDLYQQKERAEESSWIKRMEKEQRELNSLESTSKKGKKTGQKKNGAGSTADAAAEER
jgi:hypothetical protein